MSCAPLPRSLPSEDDRHAARAMTLAIARSVIAGEVSILLAARELARLRFSAAEDDSDADFLTFVAIESETDHLPIGDERRLFAAIAGAGVAWWWWRSR